MCQLQISYEWLRMESTYEIMTKCEREKRISLPKETRMLKWYRSFLHDAKTFYGFMNARISSNANPLCSSNQCLLNVFLTNLIEYSSRKSTIPFLWNISNTRSFIILAVL